MKRSIAVLILLGIVLAACGSPAQPTATLTSAPPTAAGTPAPTAPPTAVDLNALATKVAQGQHDTVTSSDGKVTLLIAQGALPANTAASAISIQPLNIGDSALAALGETPLAAYQLLPDGLHFNSPAILQITADNSTNGHVVALMSVTGQTVMPLSPTRADVDPKTGKVTLTAPITRSSAIVVHEAGFAFTLSGTGSNGDEAVNTPFQANAAVYRYSFDPPALGGAVAPNISTPAPKQGALSSWSLDGTWQATSAISPASVPNSPSQDVSGSAGIVVASNQTFTCTKASSSEAVAYSADLTFGYYYSSYDAAKGMVESDFEYNVIETLHLPINCK
ncbi:MAG TPA: hypothetical protein VHD90_09095 [Phototrophicaceae bacterium]|nr:hypothetical protein [Phototrophicaceae bacterium]